MTMELTKLDPKIEETLPENIKVIREFYWLNITKKPK